MLFLAGCSPTAHVPEPPKSKTATMSVQDVPHAMPTADTPVDSCAIADLQVAKPKPPEDWVLDIKTSNAPIKIANIYVGRTVSGRRQLKPIICGLPPMPGMETEDAILKSLRWLKEKQNEDGSWSKDAPEAVTALALLCFLIQNELPDSKEFGATVEKAGRYLTERLNALPDGGVLAPQTPEAHALATRTMAEFYMTTRLPSAKIAMEKGLAIIIANQRPDGGWAVGYKRDGGWDLAFSARQIEALWGGFVSGTTSPQLMESKDKAAAFVQKTAFRYGAFRNSATALSISPLAQAAGVFSLQLLGKKDSTEVAAALKWLQENGKVAWRDTEYHPDSPAAWLYQSETMYYNNSADWAKWKAQGTRELILNQKSDGHWGLPPVKTTDGDTAVQLDSRSYYATIYCCMVLDLGVRRHHLPTFKMDLKQGESKLDLE